MTELSERDRQSAVRRDTIRRYGLEVPQWE